MTERAQGALPDQVSVLIAYVLARCKSLAEPNALAYYTEEQITSVKSLITKGQIAEQQEKLEHSKVVWQNRKKLQNIY